MQAVDSNIALTLTQRASTHPDLTAVFEASSRHKDPARRFYQSISFSELETFSNQLAHALLESGISPGTRAVLMVKPSSEFFALSFAVFKAGIIPVLIDPGMGIKGLGKCIDESRATAFIGIPVAHLARKLFGWGRNSLNQFVTIKPSERRISFRNKSGKGKLKLSDQPASVPDIQSSIDATAAILFTSGSTGPAKGVVYSHRIFHAQVNALRDLFAIKPGEVDLCTFPLFALFAPALGMSSVIPRMNFTKPGKVNPLEVIIPAQRFHVTNLFGSPALLRRVQEYGRQSGEKLSGLKRVVSAGAPVPANVIAGVKSMLSTEAQVFTPYGATESLPVACIGSDEILTETAALTAQGKGVCVGRPVPGMNAVIINVTDGPIAEWSNALIVAPGEVGEIVVSAEQVTQKYDARHEANLAAKIWDTTQSPPRYRHRMGDLGCFDNQGRLWFCGRKSHRVWTEQGPLDTIPTEAIFNQHPAVFRSALVGIGNKGSQKPVVCIELNRFEQSNGTKRRPPNWQKIEEELAGIAAQHGNLSMIKTFLRHSGFPVDIRHNSKIFREKLAVWAAGKMGS